MVLSGVFRSNRQAAPLQDCALLQAEPGREDVRGNVGGGAKFDSVSCVQFPFEVALDDDLLGLDAGSNDRGRADPERGDRGDFTFNATIETSRGHHVNRPGEFCIGFQYRAVLGVH
jgi:hypothetical protein